MLQFYKGLSGVYIELVQDEFHGEVNVGKLTGKYICNLFQLVYLSEFNEIWAPTYGMYLMNITLTSSYHMHMTESIKIYILVPNITMCDVRN